MGAIEFFRRGLRDRRRALLGWSLGFAVYIAINVASFPSIEGSSDIDKLVEDYPESLKRLFGISGINLSTGPGYLDSQLFNLVLPLLAIVLAIGSGSKTLAGEEDDGRLELTFAYPVRRRDGVVAKGLASALEVAAVCLVSFAVIAGFGAIIDLDLRFERLAGALFGIALLGVLHGMLSLAVAGVRAGRGLAIAVPAGLAAFGYLVNGLYMQTAWLEPFRFLSTFWWLGQSPLSLGVEYARLLVLGGAAALALGAAALLIERRDLQVP